MTSVERIYQHIDAHFDAHLERVRTLVRQPSISGDGTGMAETAAMVAGLIREAGGTAEIVPTPGWPVVYGEINVGAPKTLLVYGMYDVQPVAGEKWSVPDPFGGYLHDMPKLGRCLVNRGVANQKGPLASFFNTLASFREVGQPYPVNLKFMVEGEEELGSRNLPGFVAQNRERLKADYAYFAHFSQDPSGKVIMYLGVKGILFLELIARGGDWGGPTSRGIHGSNAVWLHSPTWLLLHALTSMVTPDQKHVLIDGFYDDIIPPSAEDEALLERLITTFTPETQLAEYDVRRFKYDLTGVPLLRKYLYQPQLNIDGLISGYTGEGTKTLLPNEARRQDRHPHDPEHAAGADAPVGQGSPGAPRLRRQDRGDGSRWVSAGQGRFVGQSRGAGDVEGVSRSGLRAGDLAAPGRISAVLSVHRNAGHSRSPLAGLGQGGRQHSPDEYATVDGIRMCEKSIAAFL